MTTDGVKSGDIYLLGGRHKIMCGDATNKEHVAQLFDGAKPTLVVTSPPYAKQRDYDRPIACWDSMMMGALTGHDFADSVQIIVNLGVVHKNGEAVPYHLPWIQYMRQSGYKYAGAYIWDKLSAIPGANIGNPRPCHEFLYHFRYKRVLLNLTEVNKRAGEKVSGYNYRGRDNAIKRRGSPHTIVKSHKLIDSVIRMPPEKCNKTGHPAVFPVGLPTKIIQAFKGEQAVAYDPFLGSGTTILAAQAEDVTGLGMEISPAYTAIALKRWAKEHPDKPIIKLRSADSLA